MKNEEIESLITSTITLIKTALSNDKLLPAKGYAEMLLLLLEAQNWAYNNVKTDNKPNEKISDKHIPDF